MSAQSVLVTFPKLSAANGYDLRSAGVAFGIDYDHEVYDHTSVNEFGVALGLRW